MRPVIVRNAAPSRTSHARSGSAHRQRRAPRRRQANAYCAPPRRESSRRVNALSALAACLYAYGTTHSLARPARLAWRAGARGNRRTARRPRAPAKLQPAAATDRASEHSFLFLPPSPASSCSSFAASGRAFPLLPSDERSASAWPVWCAHITCRRRPHCNLRTGRSVRAHTASYFARKRA